jgi:methyl-accepting chemotaxis protein
MTMNTNVVRARPAVVALLLATLAPLPARAETPPAAALNAQEREMLALATDLAKRCSAVMERWIASKEVTEERLFSFLYYPMPDMDPPKYTTDYDKLSDRDIQALEETVLAKSPAVVFAILIDRNGYVPTHNLKYSQPLTGNRAVDLLNNRTKIIHNHKVGLTAGRNEAPYLFQQYTRDTGEIMPEVTVPVSVRGVHWGAVRVMYRPESL